MGIFGGGKKVTRKYHFYIHIHSVAPWPAQFRSLYVAWSRGSSKKGVTKAVAAAPGEPGRALETAFHVPCTIVQARAPRPRLASPVPRWVALRQGGAGHLRPARTQTARHSADR